MSTAIASADLVLVLGTSLSGLNADQVFVAVDHDHNHGDWEYDDDVDNDDDGGSDCRHLSVLNSDQMQPNICRAELNTFLKIQHLQ